jgi:AcrR family transcriptional regulator
LRDIATKSCFIVCWKNENRNFKLLYAHGGSNLKTMATVNPRKLASAQPRGKAFVHAVLDATLLSLADVGFERLSIPEIADLAGVNKTSIYRRWPNKTELVQAALQTATGHADTAPNTGGLRGDLVELARTTAAFTQSRVGKAVVRILFSEGDNPQLRTLAQAAYGESGQHGPWVVLKRAMERGELSNSSDPSLMLFTIAGAIMHRVFVEQRDVPDEFIEQVIDMVLLGVAARR